MVDDVANEPYLPPIAHPIRAIGTHAFDFDRQVAVMAIVNRTPDSFYDQGRTFGLEAAVKASIDAVAAGADWVDIGGVPFAPGEPLPVDEEIERIVPVVRELRAASDVVISVDTFHARVAEAAIAAGADVVNDTTALHDPDMARVVAGSDATLVITHSLAADSAGPRTQYGSPTYLAVEDDVARLLQDRVERAIADGMRDDRIVLDPGFDLNKNTLDTLRLARRLPVVCALGFPVLAAMSNKDFIGEVLEAPKPERVDGSLASAVFAITRGARIVRVHEVARTRDAVRMAEALMGWRQPADPVHNMSAFNV
ncbi:dihydropteroate synthase [Agrococcus sp. SGAir0287]|uniref:dihydropteroate synthase n=1 Tax=Agrococcus sp. SGAir0287 TaxID=2070347 RepID=UPI0010CD6BBE|nr:dihydropteroate synthase [Agrococcus sp. SGAir0287]QCR18036.1 dihydropteroate synthase [Agrococcus sp. SGAir0287]